MLRADPREPGCLRVEQLDGLVGLSGGIEAPRQQHDGARPLLGTVASRRACSRWPRASAEPVRASDAPSASSSWTRWATGTGSRSARAKKDAATSGAPRSRARCAAATNASATPGPPPGAALRSCTATSSAGHWSSIRTPAARPWSCPRRCPARPYTTERTRGWAKSGRGLVTRMLRGGQHVHGGGRLGPVQAGQAGGPSHSAGLAEDGHRIREAGGLGAQRLQAA